jgi:hypothetical protein
MSGSLERLARNQALFREVNERVEKLAESDTTEFVCECSNTECIESVELTLSAYERIRSDSIWFVIKADHDIPQIERVIFRDDGYVVVEKLVAQDDLEEMDPRSDGADKPRSAGA